MKPKAAATLERENRRFTIEVPADGSPAKGLQLIPQKQITIHIPTPFPIYTRHHQQSEFLLHALFSVLSEKRKWGTYIKQSNQFQLVGLEFNIDPFCINTHATIC
jgi:hypothetical protein